MSQRDVHQLPVLDNDRLTGVVTRGHLLQLIDMRTRLDGRDRPVPSHV